MIPIVAVPVALGLAAPAVAATKAPAHHVTDFEAVAGVFKTRALATKAVTDLTAKGMKGYTIEAERHRGFEVAHAFPTAAAAHTEVAALQKDGFKGATVERS